MNDFEMITKALEADMMNHMMTDFINEFGCYAKIYDAADAEGNIFWEDWNGNKYFETTEGEQLLKVLRDFIEVYPTITDEDCWDGQNIFETALHQCGFFDLDEDECGTDVYEYLYFQLYKITPELKN